MKTKEQYKRDYEIRMEILYNSFVDEGYDDPGYMATIEFDETANTDEVVGYYICNEGDNALKTWFENIEGIEMSEQDLEVSRILRELYDK